MPLFGPPDIAKLQAKKDFDGLVKAVGYQKDWHIRSAAATALGQIGDIRAVEPLIAHLGDEATFVRGSAAAALGQIGDPRAVEPLIAALKNFVTRNSAAAALGQIGDPRAVEPLIAALTEFRSIADVVEMTVLIAAGLGEGGGANAVRAGVVFLMSGKSQGLAGPSSEVDPRAVEPLTIALTEKLGFHSVADALDRLGWTPDKGTTGAAYWMAKGKWDRCAEIGAPAVEVLIAILEKRGPREERDSFSSWAAAAALGQIGDPRAVGPLIAALREPRNPNADANLEFWCAGGEALGIVMRDGLVMMRAHAAEALGKIGDARAVEPLTAASRSGEDAVRQAAAEALSKISGPRAADASPEDLEQTGVGQTPAVVRYESTDPGKTQRVIELVQDYMQKDHPMDATMQMLGLGAKRTKPMYRVVQGRVGRESQPQIDMMIVGVASCLPGEDVDARDARRIAELALAAIQHYAALPSVQAFFLLPYRIRTKTVAEGSPIPPEEECAVYSGVENLLLEIYDELPNGGTITDEVVERKIAQLIRSVD